MPLTPSLSADVAAALPGPDWLRDHRSRFVDVAAAEALPTDAEELWRYSRIGDLDLDRYKVVSPSQDHFRPQALDEALAAVGPRAALIVLVDGFVVHADVQPEAAAAGLVVGGADAFDDDLVALLGDTPACDAFANLNGALTTGAVAVRTPRGAIVHDPVVIVSIASTAGAAAFPHVVVQGGEASELTVVEVSLGDDAADAFVSSRLHLDVQQAANVRHVWLQRWGRAVWHVANASATVARDATLSSSAISLGGGYVRLRTNSEIVGQGGSSNLRAVYFGDGNQMHDFRVVQGHVGPKTQSDLFFKGAVGGTAHAVYSGVIRVDKGAAGTNGFQTIRNLVLSDGAWADAVPNLEIEENDVACSHATTVGPIDEEQRYYLESRGVPPEVADRLIVLGFFDEVLDKLPPLGGVRDLVRGDIAGRFHGIEVSS